MYECLYGYTPFACDDRHHTKLKILQHKKTLIFPQPEGIQEPSIEALDLMMSMLVEKERRLCSRQYEANDYCTRFQGGRIHRYIADKTHRDYQGYFVYRHDAEDIKRHPFFRDFDWDTIHLRRPPYVPRVRTCEDTKYFQEEEPISDIDTATTVDESGPHLETVNGNPPSTSKTQVSQHHQEEQHIIPSAALKIPPVSYNPVLDGNLGVGNAKEGTRAQPRVDGAFATGATLVGTGGHADGQPEFAAPQDLKEQARRKEKKRPRDIVLRDPITGPPALETRKLGSFLGYEYRQPVMAKDIVDRVLEEDLAKLKFKHHDPTEDEHDLDLSIERRLYLDSGGRILPHPKPFPQMLRCERTMFGV